MTEVVKIIEGRATEIRVLGEDAGEAVSSTQANAAAAAASAAAAQATLAAHSAFGLALDAAPNADAARRIMEKTIPLSVQAYAPTITRVAIEEVPGKYRHVPSIAVKPKSYVVAAYLANDTTPDESETYQRANFVRSTSNGTTWSAKQEELNNSTYASNPLQPLAAGEGNMQGEIHIAYDPVANQEIAVVSHRAGSYNAGFFCTRDAVTGAKWLNGRFLFDSTTGAISVSTTSISGAPPAGYKRTMTIEGVEHEIVPFKPKFAQDGRLVLPVIAMVTFGTGNRIVMFIRSAAGAWSIGGIVPLGELRDGSCWEPTVWEADDGTWYCQTRNNDNDPGTADNHALSVSPDLYSWSGLKTLDEQINLNRIWKMRGNDFWYGISTLTGAGRKCMSLHVSADGHQWVWGTAIGNEGVTTEDVGYGDIAEADGILYAVWSVQLTAGSFKYDAIRFARFAVPTAMPLMGSRRNQYALGTGTAPTVSGTQLTLPPQQVGSIVGKGRDFVVDLRFKVTAAPSTQKYRIANIGDGDGGFLIVEYRNSGPNTLLYVNSVLIETVAAPTEWRTIQIAVSLSRGLAVVLGQAMAIRNYARIYLGDTSTGVAQTGSIIYDAAGCYVTEYPYGLPEQYLPDLRPIRASEVYAKSPSESANIGVDAGASQKGILRYRTQGTTAATLTWDDAAQDLTAAIGGTDTLQLTPDLTRDITGSLYSKPLSGDANVGADAPTGQQSIVRWRINGTTKAAMIYNDAASQARVQVGGTDHVYWDDTLSRFLTTLRVKPTSGDAEFEIDGPASGQAVERFKIGGTTKAALVYSDPLSLLRLQVAGVYIAEFSDTYANWYVDQYARQAAEVTISGAATLTTSDLQARVIRYTGAAATLTLPTGTSLNTMLRANDVSWDFTVINTGSGAATIAANTGVTLIGPTSIAPGTSSTWRIRRSAAGTYTAFSIAAIERQDFNTRAAFVTWATGRTPAVGLVMRAAGLAYRYIGSGTAISDLAGWVPDGPQVFAEHFGAVPYTTQAAAGSGTDSAPALQAAHDYLAANFMSGPIYLLSNALRLGSTVTVSTASCGFVGVGMLETVLVVTHTSGEGIRFTRDNPILKDIQIAAGTTRAAVAFASSGTMCGVRLESEDAVDSSTLRLRQTTFKNVQVSNHPSHGIVAVGALTGIFENCNLTGNKGHGYAIATDIYARTNPTQVPGLCEIIGGRINNNGGHGISTAPLTDVSTPACRIGITNVEIGGNATDASVRLWPSELYLRGAQFTLQNNVLKPNTGNTTIEGFYFSGVGLVALNNRFIECVRVGTIGSHSALQTQNVLIDGVHMITHPGAYNPLVQTRVEAGASEPRGIMVRRVTGGTITAIQGTDGSYVPTYDGSPYSMYDNIDPTKQAQWQLGSITTGTIRTYTLPDVSGVVALLGGVAQTFSNSVTFSTTLSATGTTVTLGSNVATSVIGLGTGATSSGNTKTVNIGTAGASGSATTVNIGSTTSGASSTVIFNADRLHKMTTPASFGAGGTMTNASLQTVLVSYTGGIGTLTTPSGATLDSFITQDDRGVEFTVQNNGSGVCTMTGGTGVTITGTATIAIGASSIWALRRTAASTYICYRRA